MNGYDGYTKLELIGFKSNSTQWGNYWPIGIDEPVENHLGITPNPASSVIALTDPSMQPTAQYTITDITGRIVQTGTLGDGRIDLRFNGSGLLFIHIGGMTGKFIKL